VARHDPIDDCVHCGFCLPACPTYVSWGEEMDSPRGRIELLRGVRDGRIAPGPTVTTHLDRCLGCMACMTACPSGVRYDLILDRARAQVEASRVRPVGERLHRAALLSLFPRPGWLRLLVPLLWAWQRSGLRALSHRSGLVRLLPRRLAQLDALLPRVSFGAAFARLPGVTPATGSRRLRVALVEGCVQRIFFHSVNAATLRVLAAEGCEVVVPRGQGCCGALAAHVGRPEEARAAALALLDRLESVEADLVVVNAAGCGSHLKHLEALFEDDPVRSARARSLAGRVRDVTEVLGSLPARAPRHSLELRVAYQPPCHLAHAQGVRAQPVALLRAIPGLELVELADTCCGSAGVYNLIQPESADEIGARKAAAVRALEPEVVVAGNPGCLLQLGAQLRRSGASIRVAHPVELLDASLRGPSQRALPTAALGSQVAARAPTRRL
jgi:glycolate oxidase iron-sulfur subunit